jgi:hypothetical protein
MHEEVSLKVLFKKRKSMKFKVDDHDGGISGENSWKLMINLS